MTRPPRKLISSIRAPRASGLVFPEHGDLHWGRLEGSASLLDLIEGGQPLDPLAVMTQIGRAGRALEPLHRAGGGGIQPWSLRWQNDELALAIAPDYTRGLRSWGPEYGSPSVDDAPGQDLYLLGCVLFRMASGHWPRNSARAMDELRLLGGEYPIGLDAIVRACMNPDPNLRVRAGGDLDSLVEAFTAKPSEPVHLLAAGDSVTGWGKARGHPRRDNEDRLAFHAEPDDVFHAAVIDGITGDATGAGGVAAERLASELESAWQAGASGTSALEHANGRLREVQEPGGAAALLVDADADGRIDLVSVGDCLAYLVRPVRRTFAASRLNPEDSAAAEIARRGESLARTNHGVLTACVDGGPIAPHVRSLRLSAGDVLLLASDGVAGHEDSGFVDDLEAIANDVGGDHALLTARLISRAQDLGGRDNTTVLSIRAREKETR